MMVEFGGFVIGAGDGCAGVGAGDGGAGGAGIEAAETSSGSGACCNDAVPRSVLTDAQWLKSEHLLFIPAAVSPQ